MPLGMIRIGWLLCLFGGVGLSTCWGQTNAYTYPFSKTTEGWAGWGTGKGGYASGLGHKHPGSLMLSCEVGQHYTFHRRFRKLPPGRYLVSAWLRALDVEQGKWNYAIWLFYDAGKGTQSPTTGLHGTFSWSRVKYTVEVDKAPLQLWFRLKSGGTLWVDDIQIKPHKGAAIPFSFERAQAPFPRSNPRGKGHRCQGCYRWWAETQKRCPVCGGKVTSKRALWSKSWNETKTLGASSHGAQKVPQLLRKEWKKRRLLVGFEEQQAHIERRRHPFRDLGTPARQGKRAALLEYARYYNFSMKGKEMTDWSGYATIAMEVHNPLKRFVRFALCLNDKSASSYWDQLNHYTQLAPGWNSLRFSLVRSVGERGSIRHSRFLKLSNMKRFWVAVAPEDKAKVTQRFALDHVRLERAKPIPPPGKNWHLFDFVKKTSHTLPGFVPILPRHRYSKEVGFGFRHAKVWRVLDAKYADSLLRDAILLNKGEFLVDVPPGDYSVWLFARSLGFWFEHTWKRQRIWLQNKLVHEEHRHHARDVLAEFLRFQDVEPKPTDHPYSLYLQPLLRPIMAQVRVQKGPLSIRVQSRPSGAALNALLIVPRREKKRAHAWLQQLARVQQEEFNQLTRRIRLVGPPPTLPKQTVKPVVRRHSNRSNTLQKPLHPNSTSPRVQTNKNVEKTALLVSLLSATQSLRPHSILPSIRARVVWQGGIGERPYQSFLVRNQTKRPMHLEVHWTDWKGEKGAKIPAFKASLRYGVYQFQCHQFNHETYELAPRFLRPFPPKGRRLAPQMSRLLWLQMPLEDSMKPGLYRSHLTFRLGREVRKFPMEVRVYPFHLPEVDRPIGFFGLDPVPLAHVSLPGVASVREAYRMRALRMLRARGFSTWSGLPAASLQRGKGAWSIRAPAIDSLMKQARKLGFKHPIFSYGGSFLDTLVRWDTTGSQQGSPLAVYRKKSAKALQEAIERGRWLPLIASFSDEASGYSRKVERDQKRAEVLRRHFPFLRRGSFTHSIAAGKYGSKLNRSTTDLSLSSYTKSHLESLQKRGARWGAYNIVPGLFAVGRASFGRALFVARARGLSHRLEWHFAAAQNYPYYDLDGREYDAMMAFPRRDGSLDAAIRLEWATLGLEDYRLLLLLESLAQRAGSRGKSTRRWLRQQLQDAPFFATKNYLRFAEEKYRDIDALSYRKQLYKRINFLWKED